MVVAQERSHLPVIVDPSHGTGGRSLVAPMALAAVAAGADGIMIDVHADPASARCDGPQALLPDEVVELGARLRELATWTGRRVDPVNPAKEVETDVSSADIRTIGVLGAGVMGGGIAQVCATGGYDVVCYDIAPAALDAGREHATTGRYGLESGVERGKLTREEADAATARLHVHRHVRGRGEHRPRRSRPCPSGWT